MKGKGAIEKDGKLTLITTSGTFTVGAEQLERIMTQLAARGIQITNQQPPEQHRHDDKSHNHESEQDHELNL
jgi:hypothetical protein